MSDKEMLKEADEWLYSMKCLLSVKTDEEDRAYTQKRIDLFNWLIQQAERVQDQENLINEMHDNLETIVQFINSGQQERVKEVTDVYMEYFARKQEESE